MTDTEKTGFVILHFGPMNIEKIQQITDISGPDAVFGTDVARMAGATLAIGPKDLLQNLRQRLSSGAYDEVAARHPEASREMLIWLATGERGLSAEAIFTRLSGIDIDATTPCAHPHDADDLRLCRLLLEAVPEFAGRIGEMSDVSRPWARLVKEWDAICSTMDAEIPTWHKSSGPAPKTYHLMKSVLDLDLS